MITNSQDIKNYEPRLTVSVYIQTLDIFTEIVIRDWGKLHKDQIAQTDPHALTIIKLPINLYAVCVLI